MDTSKIHEETHEECSSNESGWTMYIASSPDRELEYDDYEDEEEYSNGGRQTYTKDDFKKEAHEDVDSDDSMASDASSGPSYQGHLYERVERIQGSGHAENKRGNKHVEKKHDEKKKEAKDKYGNKKRSAAKSKNK